MHQFRTISVIIPAHNEESSLPGLFKALAAQTYPKAQVEWIVVDNRSTDGTARVAVASGAKIVTENSDASSDVARNAGIAHAGGMILAFTDADCRPDPDWLEALVKEIPEGADCVAAGQVIIQIDEHSSGAQIYDSMAFLNNENSVQYRKIAFTANLAVPKSVAVAVGRFPTRSKTNGDGYFVRKCYQYGCDLVYVSEAIVRHPPRQLGELLLKVKRIASGNVRGGNRDSEVGIQRRDGYKRGVRSLLTMPHFLALNPLRIVNHLNARQIQPTLARVGSTWVAAFIVIFAAAFYSGFFYSVMAISATKKVRHMLSATR